ncbi:P-loop containing nucleoside triphosphate hydrolase protein [Macrophomina phaseolina]|uniref:P-loop containing nucleoside triphosphate hydrolase protein n=1 Tax=Macrophomina phaseolina TaxID=35725 RepID=A0ABQ8G5F4_9PEZI|nr:P-loop containing nucleoside triphosphate hydrolase protein [Macrophomina phaseolina]
MDTTVLPDSPDDGARRLAPASESSSWSADFVSGKGEGLIFLLHGKPGVGKTYTAECVAAHTERPLLSLTCADIGTDPEKVEKRLQRWFKIAASWGAIMLIDEADIYMEHRQVQDLARNNLVAGFLRALEYYQGILFLTTNRVGTFDEAFISRIHIMIHYPPLTNADREAVWEGFFKKLVEEQGETMTILEDTRDYVVCDEVHRLKWNGREIRNAFQIAVALAQTEESRDKRGRIQVTREHIKSTVRMSRDFKEYLTKLYKKDETQRAAMAGIRDDTFGATGSGTGGARYS